MKHKKFSVIIPCYNSEKFIEKAIFSIINQTYDNWELIIVNDGSTDNSQQIIDKIIKTNKSKNIFCKVIDNSGPSTARNVGLKMATGDYVCFLDSDDEYDNNLLHILNEIDSDFDICFWGWKDILEDGTIIDRVGDFEFPEGILTGIEVLKKKYLHQVWLCNCSEVYKRKMLVDNNVAYPEGVYAGEDACFIYTSLLYAEKVIAVPQPLFLCYTRNSSLMHSKFNQRNLTEFVAIETIIKNISECGHLKEDTKQELTNMFLALNDFVKISIAKKIFLENSSYFKWLKILNNYLPDKKVNVKIIKKYMRKKEYIQAVLFKHFKLFFYIACKINYRRKRK